MSNAAVPEIGSDHARSREKGNRRSDLCCAYCQRFFSKQEHLRRHERSHIGTKAFVCDICQRSFGRQDSLKRHTKTHHDSGEQRRRRDRSLPSADNVDHVGLLTLAQATHDIEVARELAPVQQPAEEPYTPFEQLVGSGSHLDAQSHDRSVPLDGQPWSGREDLLSMLMNEEAAWPMDLTFDLDPQLEDTQGHNTSVRARQAIADTRNLIQDLSFNLAREVESTGVTSDFLETCLHTFFDRFVTIFPVSHQPTFSLKDCAHPLLLNMIALGSLFVASDDAIDRGEALWRLAHTAVATSWQGMMNNLNQGDMTAGVQLVMTALLGQSYAVLSRNRSARLTSHIFHSLGFYWARQCGMPVRDPFIDVPPSTSPDKHAKWKAWAAQETRHRALLGHYILDGLISQSSGLPTSDRHMTNAMVLPSSDVVYDAQTVDAWIDALHAHPQSRTTFREIYVDLFASSPTLLEHIQLDSLAIRVVLEGIYALISDQHHAGGPCIGIPAPAAISNALHRIRSTQIDNLPSALHSGESRMDLLLRWHTIAIDLCINSNQLVCSLCRTYKISQNLCSSGRTAPDIDLSEWTRRSSARAALLHATAIQDLATNLPFGRMQSIHVPLAVFTASTVFVALILGGCSRVSMLSSVDWGVVCNPDRTPTSDEGHELSAVLTANFLDPNYDISTSSGFTSGSGFAYSVNTLLTVLESVGKTWGVAREMSGIVTGLYKATKV